MMYKMQKKIVTGELYFDNKNCLVLKYGMLTSCYVSETGSFFGWGVRVCVYVCRGVCICMSAYVYMCMHICMYICMHKCMYICIHVLYVYVCIGVCVFAYVCMYSIYVDVYMYI
jgi:hypothetical protein